MNREYIKKRLKDLKKLAELQATDTDKSAQEFVMILHDVFKFIIERISPNDTRSGE